MMSDKQSIKKESAPIKKKTWKRKGCISDTIVEDVNPQGGRSFVVMRNGSSISPDELRALADEYVQWAQTTDCVKYSSFGVHKGIWPTQFALWREKCPKLNNAHELVKAIFAERRERRALDGQWNSGIVMATMPLYDVEYANWRRELKAKEDESRGNITVHIDSMPTTNLVAR